MNHDATHCFNYSEECPKTCYRAQLTEELNRIDYDLPVSFAMFKHTDHCPKWPKPKKEKKGSNISNERKTN